MSEPSAYRHTQVGYLAAGALAVTMLVGLSQLMTGRPQPVAVAALLFLALALVNFASLTIAVDGERVVARFGPGLIRVSFRLADIETVRVIRNSPLWGWGLRLVSTGWLFNISGLWAVELHMKNGRRHRLGSDEPEALAGAIQTQLQERAGGR
jgi:hypothetical protein